MKKINVFLVDAHRLIADTWTTLLNTDQRFAVTGFATDSHEAISAIRKYRPDVVLTDLIMQPLDGFELTRSILEICPECNVIGVSIYNSASYAKRMIAMGAMGYVSKSSSKEELYRAIVEVSEGRKFLCSEIKDKIVEEKLLETRYSVLTRKELQIISLLREGLSSKEIAGQEKISRKTVEVHRNNILKKLRLTNISAL
jgi:DNA-binding NarL/FixJ family response regulator